MYLTHFESLIAPAARVSGRFTALPVAPVYHSPPARMAGGFRAAHTALGLFVCLGALAPTARSDGSGPAIWSDSIASFRTVQGNLRDMVALDANRDNQVGCASSSAHISPGPQGATGGLAVVLPPGVPAYSGVVISAPTHTNGHGRWLQLAAVACRGGFTFHPPGTPSVARRGTPDRVPGVRSIIFRGAK